LKERQAGLHDAERAGSELGWKRLDEQPVGRRSQAGHGER
jgi:hypothetical protein